MRITIATASVPVALAVAVLSGCNGGASSSSFAPSATAPQSIAQTTSHEQPNWGTLKYYLLTLDSLGGDVSFAININDSSQATGTSLLSSGDVEHAQAWVNPPKTVDLGTLGGPNSAVFQYLHGPSGQFVGWSETSATDPNDENFCGFGTTHTCLGFSWQRGKMRSLPPIGGYNDNANDLNWRGQIVGASETNTIDSTCVAPRVYDFLGVIWQPNGKTTTLPPYSGDTVSYAYTMTQSGQIAVGQSGPCSAPATHAVLWQNASSPINLGNLGGTVNVALDVNDLAEVIGNSDLAGNTTTHSFLWKHGALTDLGTLPGDAQSFAGGINDESQIVGESCDASGNCRGYLDQNGTMTDLNSLITPNKSINILFGGNINDLGEIVGATVNTSGLESAVLLIPYLSKDGVRYKLSASKVKLPQNLRARLEGSRGKFWDLRKPRFPR